MFAPAPRPSITADQVLRAQGADPARVAARGGRARALAEQALAEGTALLDPSVCIGRHRIRRAHHGQVFLEGGMRLRHPVLGAGLVGATELTAVALTIGQRVEDRIRGLGPSRPAYALALDGFATAAVLAISDRCSAALTEAANARGLTLGRALSPGMRGWPVVPGQMELLRLIHPLPDGLALTPAGMLRPAKSLTFLVGAGAGVLTAGHACDYCDQGARCRHRPAG